MGEKKIEIIFHKSTFEQYEPSDITIKKINITDYEYFRICKMFLVKFMDECKEKLLG